MVFEEVKFVQETKKNKEKSEAEQKLEMEKRLIYAVKNERLMARIEKDKKLTFLKSLIERSLIQTKIVEKLVENEGLDLTELEDIFAKIDAINDEENIDSILPPELRISKKEYIQTLENTEEKVFLIQKIQNAIHHINLRSRGHSHAGIGIFVAFFKLLDRNLEANMIRVKQNLLAIASTLKK